MGQDEQYRRWMHNHGHCFKVMFTLVAATLDPMDATVSIQFYKKNKIGNTKKKW